VGAGDGDFLATFKARHKGFRRVRAIFRGDGTNSSARVRKPLRIYREDLATWYGPGFYGNSTACGKTLKRSTLGVAHRTLPCGASVSILYGGRTITVTVIDRGPYSGANWDLTEETAERLGFSGSDEIGVTR
jgi:rare lipoprotein A (peptidoglycan hydrolase)